MTTTLFNVVEDGVHVQRDEAQIRSALGVTDNGSQGAVGDAHAAETGNPHGTAFDELVDVDPSAKADQFIVAYDEASDKLIFRAESGEGAVSFAAISGSPSDNTALANALATKYGTDNVPGVADIDGLQADLDAKVNTSLVGASNGLATLTGTTLTTAQLPTHTHAESDVTNLVTDLETLTTAVEAANPSRAASKLVGRGSAAGAGTQQEITLGTGLSMSGTTLSVEGATLPDVAASKLVGRGSGGGTGQPEEITLGTGLSMSGTTLSVEAGEGGRLTGGNAVNITLLTAFANMQMTIAANTTLVGPSGLAKVYANLSVSETVDFGFVCAGAVTGLHVLPLFSPNDGSNYYFASGTEATGAAPASPSTAGAVACDATGSFQLRGLALHSSLRVNNCLISFRVYGDGTHTGTATIPIVRVAGDLPAVGSTGGGGDVASVFGRTGTVVAASGDYTAAQVSETSTAKIMTGDERTKLSGIETGATADQTGAEIVSAINTNLGGTTWQQGSGAGGGAPTDATYYVASANSGLSAEVVLVSPLVAADKGVANGLATLDSSSPQPKLAAAQLPTHSHAQGDITGLTAALAAKALLREGTSETYSSASVTGVGLNESHAFNTASGVATWQLTADLSAQKFTATNRSASAMSLQSVGTGASSIEGGTITLPAFVSEAEPQSVCIGRVKPSNHWARV